MVRLLIFTLMSVLIGCGSGGGGGSGGSAGACVNLPFKGTWLENAGATDQYIFRENCTGSNLNCSYTYTHNAPIDPSGTLHLTVTTASGGGGCPTVGQVVNCVWSIPGAGQLIMNCDAGGNIQYSKTAN